MWNRLHGNGAPPEGDAPPMGVSFHRAGRRFEGRESAASDLNDVYARRAEPRLNAAVRKPPMAHWLCVSLFWLFAGP